jgi:FKBP-type peptidyl-prolyl cis-trans isomerase
MKLKLTTTLCLIAFGLTAARAEDSKITLPGMPKAPAAAPAKPEFTDTQVLEFFGWFVGKRVGLPVLELSQPEIESLIKGLNAAAAGKDSPYEAEKIGPLMDEMMQKKMAATIARQKEKGLAASAAFFTKLKENKNVVESQSGLRYEIVKQGDGPGPKPEDIIKAHYTGTLVDGKVFDSSVKRGTPIEIPLNQVVAGWTEGIQKIGKGGKIKLYVPPSLGYGDETNGDIPAGSTLVFDVELIDFKSTPAAPTALPTPGKP